MPGVVGRSYFLLIGLDEEGLLAAVSEAAFGVGIFVFREEPEARRAFGSKVAEQGYLAVRRVSLI
jgi:hypothetical protein